MASDDVPNSPAAADPAVLSAEAAPLPADAAAPSPAPLQHSQEYAAGARSTEAGQRPPAEAKDEDDEPWAAPAAPAPVPRQLKRLQRRCAAGAAPAAVAPHEGGRASEEQLIGAEAGEQTLQQDGAGGSDSRPCSPGRTGGDGGGAQEGASADTAGRRAAPPAVSPGSGAEGSARDELEGSDAGAAARRSAPSAMPTSSGSGSGDLPPEYWDEEDELYRNEFERVKRHDDRLLGRSSFWPDRHLAPAVSESSDGSGSNGSSSNASGAGALRSLDLPAHLLQPLHQPARAPSRQAPGSSTCYNFAWRMLDSHQTPSYRAWRTRQAALGRTATTARTAAATRRQSPRARRHWTLRSSGRRRSACCAVLSPALPVWVCSARTLRTGSPARGISGYSQEVSLVQSRTTS